MTRFDSAFLDKIRGYFTLSDYIGSHVKLTRAGKEYHGLCPFHSEKSPSFTVNNDKQFYHCFGCQAHGDVIDFVSHLHKQPFPEAVVMLATQAGIPLPANDSRGQANSQEDSAPYQALEAAAKWFQGQLYGPHGAVAREYLAGRGIHDTTIESFRIGYAPNDFSLLSTSLKREGFNETLLHHVGLTAVSEHGKHYDRFRHRVIFPILDMKQRVIAFGGRRLGGEDAGPKYLNSPETDWFKKGYVLYAENWARPQALALKDIILTEGYMDTIMLHQAGITNAVATLGTSITVHHLARLWHYADEPCICMDGDAAGQASAVRLATLALTVMKAGKGLQLMKLPLGMDPDDLIRYQGAGAFTLLKQQALSMSELLWTHVFALYKGHTAEERARLETALIAMAESAPDRMVQKHMKQYFMDMVWRSAKRSLKPVAARALPQHTLSADEQCDWSLLVLIMEYPLLLESDRICSEFEMIDFSTELLDRLRGKILQLKESAVPQALTAEQIREMFLHNGDEDIMRHIDSQYASLCRLPDKTSMITLETIWDIYMKQRTLMMMQKEYSALIANKQSDDSRFMALHREIQHLNESVRMLKSQLDAAEA